MKGTGLPTMPYIIESREVETEELADLAPPTSKQAVYNLFKKSKEAMKDDWRTPKVRIGLQTKSDQSLNGQWFADLI